MSRVYTSSHPLNTISTFTTSAWLLFSINFVFVVSTSRSNMRLGKCVYSYSFFFTYPLQQYFFPAAHVHFVCFVLYDVGMSFYDFVSKTPKTKRNWLSFQGSDFWKYFSLLIWKIYFWRPVVSIPPLLSLYTLVVVLFIYYPEGRLVFVWRVRRSMMMPPDVICNAVLFLFSMIFTILVCLYVHYDDDIALIFLSQLYDIKIYINICTF